MKRIAVAWVASALLLFAGPARAETVTIEAGEDLTNVFGHVIGPLQSQARFAFSDVFLGALSIANLPVVPVLLTYIEETGEALYLVAPVQRVTGDVDPSSAVFDTQRIETAVGMSISVNRRFTGAMPRQVGSVVLSNLTVDLTSKGIYVDVTGDNGVGTVQGVRFWEFASVSGSGSVPLASCSLAQFPDCPPLQLDGLQLSGLSITQQGFDLFAQALAFTAIGKSSMAAVTDYGTLTISAVPEPSTIALMGLGLIGLAVHARRRPVTRLTQPAHRP